MVTFNMYMTRPWLQEGAGGITASLGTCPGVLVTAASSLALSGALGVQQSKTTRWIPLEFLVGLCAPDGSAQGRGAASMDLGDEHNSQVALSLLQHCLCAVL